MKYYCDGFVLGSNPSALGGGFTVTDGYGKVIERRVKIYAKFTNNEGEILGIARAIQIASEGDTISTDSQCALAWIVSGKCKARPDLLPIITKAKRRMLENNIKVVWEPREVNLAGFENEKINPFRDFAQVRCMEVLESVADEWNIIHPEMPFLSSDELELE